MRIFLLLSCIALSSCATEQKLNIITETPDEISVIPPACPNWIDSVEGGLGSNDPHSNYGCATVINYGVMVTNPRDMVVGRGRTEADGGRSALAVTGYNNGVLGSGEAAAASASEATSSDSTAAQ